MTLADLALSQVVTGATAGIGRDFALQLAGAGFNVFLASRTTSKLEEISKEISESTRLSSRTTRAQYRWTVYPSAADKYPNIKTQVHAIDFAGASTADYEKLGEALAPLDIGVLSEFRAVSIHGAADSLADTVAFCSQQCRQIVR